MCSFGGRRKSELDRDSALGLRMRLGLGFRLFFQGAITMSGGSEADSQKLDRRRTGKVLGAFGTVIILPP